MIRRCIRLLSEKGQVVESLEELFYSTFKSEAFITNSAVRDWLKNSTAKNLTDTVFQLRLGQRFGSDVKAVEKIASACIQNNFIDNVSPLGLSVLASTLAAAPKGKKMKQLIEQIFQRLEANTVILDSRVLGRFCHLASVHQVSSDTRNFLINAIKDTCNYIPPEEIRWVASFLRTASIDDFILPKICANASLMSPNDLAEVLLILASWGKIHSALPPAFEAVKLAVLRQLPHLNENGLSDVAFALGKVGGWNVDCGQILERKIIAENMKIDQIAKVLVGTVGSINGPDSKQWFLNGGVVRKMINRFLKARGISLLTNVRVLWAISAGDLQNFPPQQFCDKSWTEASAKCAQQVNVVLRRQLIQNIPQSLKGRQSLEMWAMLDELHTTEPFQLNQSVQRIFNKGIESARDQLRSIRDSHPITLALAQRGELKDGVLWSGDIGVTADYGPVPPKLRIAGKKLNVIDALSWIDRDEVARNALIDDLLTRNEPGVVCDAKAINAKPFEWIADEIKVPPQAFKFSLRRANSQA